MKKINETLTAVELAKFAKHNKNQAQGFPEYAEFFEKRASAAQTVLSCFWTDSVAQNLMRNVSTSEDGWRDLSETYESEATEIPWD